MILILVVSVIVVGALAALIGRWLQRKGTNLERNRKNGPR